MTKIIEKEIKVLNIKKKKLIKKLEKMGATLVFDGMIEDTYYDTPDQDLAKEKKRLRIRKHGNNACITMKKKLSSNNLRKSDEHEIDIVCPYETAALFRTRGLHPIREKRKYRIAYTYDGVHFDIDCYEGIPPILEIEADTKKSIFSWIKKLGLEKKTTATFGSRGLFRHYDLEDQIAYIS